MAYTTVNVAIPVIKTKKGHHEMGSPVRASTADEAKRRAERMSQTRAGGIAISRSGDAEFGEFDGPILLGVFGDVPSALLRSLNATPF